MCWAKIKAFFSKGRTAGVSAAESAVKAPGAECAEAQARAALPVNPADWTYADPMSYFMDGDEVVVLKRARDFYLMKDEDKDAVAAVIRASVEDALERQLAEAGERGVLETGVAAADALYKGAVRLYDNHVKASAMAPYLKATAKPLFEWLQARGLQVSYCTNCAFETMDAVWHEFPEYFGATGLVYICPQNTALQMLQANGKGEADYDDDREAYLNNAFFMVRRVQKECAAKNRSYVCLDADGNTRTYATTLEGKGEAGRAVVERTGALRNAAHQSFAVAYPEETPQEPPAGEDVPAAEDALAWDSLPED